MQDYLSTIDTEHPVRNSAEQKAAFRAWALREAEHSGFTAASEAECGGHRNLIFGDARRARVLFTAHYDTPRRMIVPNLMLVTNRVLYWAYNIGIVLVLAGLSLGAAFAVRSRVGAEGTAARLVMVLVFYAVYALGYFLFFRGPANRHNRNDNTSGTAAVMKMMRMLGEDSGAAFILFDDEEKGKKGSKAFVRDHPEIGEGTLTVNLDCVGNGDTFLFCPSPGAVLNPLYREMAAALEEHGDVNARFYPPRRAQMNSDHRSFAQGVGVCACRRVPFAGYCTGRIHTARDTVAEPETVMKLASALADFVRGSAPSGENDKTAAGSRE